MTKYRVWPDGTVQELPAEPYAWLSDDYVIVEAVSETHAELKALALTRPWNKPPGQR